MGSEAQFMYIYSENINKVEHGDLSNGGFWFVIRAHEQSLHANDKSLCPHTEPLSERTV